MSARLTDLQLRILTEQWAPAADELIALRAENGRLRAALTGLRERIGRGYLDEDAEIERIDAALSPGRAVGLEPFEEIG